MLSALRQKIPPAPGWAFALVALAAFAFLVRVYAGVWSPEYGITKFLVAGRVFDDRGTAVYRATPKFLDPYPAHRWGFDGQIYAEIALDPLLRDPQLRTALDNPPYRARRILLPWLAWLGGLGRPFWVLNVYAGLNLVFWIAYAWLTARLFRPHGWAGLAGYAAILLTCGIFECMLGSLTDFPSFVLMVAAIVAGGAAGTGLLAAAGLMRETCLLGFVALVEWRRPWREFVRANFLRGVLVAAPMLLWTAYVFWRFRGMEIDLSGGNLTWPLHAIMEKLGEFTVTARSGSIRWHKWYFELYKNYDLHALLTIISVLTQCVYLALHREWRNRLWQMAAVFGAYFLCISYLSWDSHFTVTRHALPITLVFNLLLAARPRRGWLIWFLLGNCFVPFGLRYFDSERIYRAPPPPIEYTLVAPAAGQPVAPVQLQYVDGWSPQQWDPERTWRWATGATATLVLRNDAAQPVRVGLSFRTRTRAPRNLRVTLGGRVLFERELPVAREVVALPAITLAPGETPLAFATDGAPTDPDDDTPVKVTFLVENPRLKTEPAPARAAAP